MPRAPARSAPARRLPFGLLGFTFLSLSIRLSLGFSTLLIRLTFLLIGFGFSFSLLTGLLGSLLALYLIALGFTACFLGRLFSSLLRVGRFVTLGLFSLHRLPGFVIRVGL